MQPKSKTQSKANSTTRSLDTRSTSCDREEELGFHQQRSKQNLWGMHFTMAQPFRSNSGLKRKDYPDLTGKKIETVLEEEENDVLLGIIFSTQKIE